MGRRARDERREEEGAEKRDFVDIVFEATRQVLQTKEYRPLTYIMDALNKAGYDAGPSTVAASGLPKIEVDILLPKDAKAVFVCSKKDFYDKLGLATAARWLTGLQIAMVIFVDRAPYQMIRALRNLARRLRITFIVAERQTRTATLIR